MEVKELSENPNNRVTEIREGEVSIMIGWSEKTIILWDMESGKKETVKSFDDLCFKSQGILSGELLMNVIEIGIKVYDN